MRKLSCLNPLYFIASAFLLSCGVKTPTIEEQSSTEMKNPEWSDYRSVFTFVQDGMQLSANNKNHDFEGSAILWNPEANPEKVSQVLKLSEQSKISKNSYLEEMQVIPKLRAKVKKRELALQEKRLESKNALNTPYYKDHSAQLSSKSQAWVKSQIASGKQAQFETFCEIELLRFAVSDFLRLNTFTSRPEPLAICSDYYKSKGMFTSASCSNVPESAPGNYSRCIWESGVLQAAYALYVSTSPTSSALASADQVRDFLDRIEEVNVFFKSAMNEKSFQIFGSLGKNFKLGVLKSPPALNQIKNHLAKSAKEFTDITDAFTNIAELTKPRHSDSLTIKFNFNDRLMNFHLLKNQSESPSLTSEDLKLLKKFHEEFPQLFGAAPCFNDPTVSERESLEKRIANLEEKIAKAKKLAEVHEAKFIGDYDKNSAKLLTEENLAFSLFSQLELKMSPFENFILVELSLDPKAKILAACFEWSTGESRNCPQQVSGEAMKVSFNKESGLLSMDYCMEDPDKIGFKELAKNDGNANFQLIPHARLSKKTLHIELYPRRFREHLDILTGLVQVKDSQTILYQGNMALNLKLPH